MNALENARAIQRMVDHGCIACFKAGIMNQPPDLHHLNLDNKAGQKRLGEFIRIPLCPWHHRGICFDGIPVSDMHLRFGPSRALHKRAFVEEFGRDEALLAEYEDRARMMDDVARGAA